MNSAAAQLQVVAGKAAGMTILVEDSLLIGRHAEGAGRLADDEEISRSHARVSLDASGFCAIEDLGSTNGTFVNGLRISGPQALAKGDMIELGATTLLVRDLPATDQPATAEPTITPAAAQPTIVPGVDVATARTSPPPSPAVAEEPPALSLRLKVDFGAREATIILDESSDQVRLRFEDGAWRTEPRSSPAEEEKQ